MAFFILLTAALPVDVRAAESKGPRKGEYQSIEELAGKRIGVKHGTIFDSLVMEKIPNAELNYYFADVDMLGAMEAGKIDACVMELPTLRATMKEETELTYLEEPISESRFGFVFPKSEEGEKLNRQFSAYIKKIKEEGVLEEMDEIWTEEADSGRSLPNYTSFPDTNGSLTLASTGQSEPFNYVKDGQVVGLDIDLAARFCREQGYRLEVRMMNFDEIITSVKMGKCDFGASSISINKQRTEHVDFSEPYYTSQGVIVVRKKTEEGGSFLAIIQDGIQKTFIQEGRYKLFLSGVGTTLLITALSILFGTVLGFLLYMACRRGNRAANGFARFFVWFIKGMPEVVLLMILYYIVFANSPISGAAVSIIAFTLVFGSGAFNMLKSSVETISDGQREAALSLGYGDLQAFFRVILPQAMPRFLPAYKAEVVTLIKATAIVGYIAVQDLTKMGDIVRSRTYEAIFPLIVVAIIYFALGALLTFLVNRIEINANPRMRKREEILKGVKIRD